MLEREKNGVLAESCEVRRHDTTVAIVLEIDLVELSKARPDEKLYVVAAFDDPSDANHIRRSLGKAIDDASAAKARGGRSRATGSNRRRP